MEKMKILRDTISNVLEEMFFLVEETPPDDFHEVYSYLTAIEDSLFSIRIYMGIDLAREITINFLGIAEMPEDEDVIDCLQEVLNMITGNFVGTAYPNHDKLLPFPKCEAFREPFSDNAPGYDNSLIFYKGQPLRIQFLDKS